MKRHHLRIAWEAFMEGREPPPTLRPEVLTSWKRSQGYRIDVARSHAPLLGEAELFRRRGAHGSLLQAARPALTKARIFLADANAMVLLTDPTGLIIEASGDPRTMKSGRQIHLKQGGHWAEAEIGTNAIGTAIAASEPVQIHAGEHFCAEVQRWTCAAAPIHHPLDGRLLGILDISGPESCFHPQSLAHAVMAGQHVEAMLERSARADHDLLLQSLFRKRTHWLTDDYWLSMNAVSWSMPPTIACAALTVRIPVCYGAERCRPWRICPANIGPPGWKRLLPGAAVELVCGEARSLGALIVLRRSRRAAPESARVARPPPTHSGFDAILGQSDALRAIVDRARRFAESDVPILIEGETGVGKELFAHAIHQAGAARSGAFVPVNCGGLPRELIASELFGYVDGAFTGAHAKGRPGKISPRTGGCFASTRSVKCRSICRRISCVCWRTAWSTRSAAIWAARCVCAWCR